MSRRRHTDSLQRRGVATLWLVVWLPVLLVLFCVIVGVAHLWLARVEVETGLESAALAAAKHWGDQGGGDTAEARQIGVAFAQATNVRGNPLLIESNYDPAAAPCDPANPNQNLTYELDDSGVGGNLIFGAIEELDTDNDPGTPNQVVFDAGTCPGDDTGSVLVDATGNGGGSLGQGNAWGIAFHKPNGALPTDLKIEAIEIDLRGGVTGGSGAFVPSLSISENEEPAGNAVRDQSGNDQDDTVGFNVAEINDPADTQIEWSVGGAGNSVLRFDFRADPTNPGGDQGFEPGDRFRFGIDVTKVSAGNAADDADGVGREGAIVTIYFRLGGIALPPVRGAFVDNSDLAGDCINPAAVNPVTGTLVVHPSLVPDLPCPETSLPGDNGQSYVVLRGAGSRRYGVLAQASSPVQKFNFPLLGSVDRYAVQARAIAEYDGVTRRVRLIRVDQIVTP